MTGRQNNPAHEAVDGGFECDCGEVRETPLGIARHRARCDGGDADGE